jgi:hypothetical protein
MGRGFKSLYLHLDSIAQLVELSALNRKVVGSIPTGITALDDNKLEAVTAVDQWKKETEL